jgi:hypothetical protein
MPFPPAARLTYGGGPGSSRFARGGLASSGTRQYMPVSCLRKTAVEECSTGGASPLQVHISTHQKPVQTLCCIAVDQCYALQPSSHSTQILATSMTSNLPYG